MLRCDKSVQVYCIGAHLAKTNYSLNHYLLHHHCVTQGMLYFIALSLQWQGARVLLFVIQLVNTSITAWHGYH